MDIKAKIGARFRDIRKEKKLTQEKVSFEADIDKSYISEVENGLRNISIVNLEKLTATVGVSLKDFFNTPDFA